MTHMARCIESLATDPYGNLAVEECLLRSVRPGQRVLYLWQNERTVVVGRNQHASAECDLAHLAADGGHLARRLSGGGAVYHDLGNLNFTFVCPTDEYDQTAQTDVILDAVRSLGVEAVRTGRNDLVTTDGRKFSGHAYYHAGSASFHHGTLMVDVDVDALDRYLSVDPDKLASKGVRSVRSRVTNLVDVAPGLTVPALKEALIDAFFHAEGCEASVLDTSELDQAELEASRRRFCSPTWLFRGERDFARSRGRRFSWGLARVDTTVRDGIVRDLAFFSDGLETEHVDRVPELLIGSPAEVGAIEARLRAGGMPHDMAHDIAGLVADAAQGD